VPVSAGPDSALKFKEITGGRPSLKF